MTDAALPETVQPLGHGIFAIDTGFHRPLFDAAYLVVENGRALFIDTGANPGVPRLLAALDALGIARDHVDHVIPTHVHLDHAGGAGLLMQALPAATMLIHPRGERHMVDPSALVAGATEVYGPQEMARAYGTIVPVPAERVRATHDGQVLDWHGRRFTILDTPGHARHHHCLFDERSRGWFTGDTFGLSYREFDTDQGPWLLPTTTPVQFEPAPLKDSIRRMLAFEPEALYLTHYSRVGRDAAEVRQLGEGLIQQVDEMVELAQAWWGQPASPARHAALKAAIGEQFLRRVRQHGCTVSDADTLALLAVDLELNAQGLGVWMDRAARGR
jgi:glyoxylase-like metal-dependent hydrolase (beta-lactamase superfamily II)